MLRLISVLAIVSSFFIASCSNNSSKNASNIYTESYKTFQQLNYLENIEQDSNRIQPYKANPWYWQYKGEPVLLLGASDEDNLFIHSDIWPFGLESHLDLMVKYGGNYVRNTMSYRDAGNLKPFNKSDEELYDLNSWNEAYWQQFKHFLDLTYERDIIVQIEVWDRFDYARGHWGFSPFNPKNNVNYTAEESKLPLVITSHAGARENPFLRTPPHFEDNPLVLKYQQALIKKMLSISMDYPNVLYCISNETNESPLWSDYWAYFIYNEALEKGVRVNVTEMWDSWDVSSSIHDATYKKPDLYTFVDISQNNHQQGQTHWDNAQQVRNERLNSKPRPINSVKIYGATTHGGNFEEGTRKLWRNIFGGFASSRFHRTGNRFAPYGLGLSALAQKQLKSMRMFTSELNIFKGRPSNHLLSNREEDEAYAIADAGHQYGVYFTNGGSVKIDLSKLKNRALIKWLDIMNNRWQNTRTINADTANITELTPPSEGPWAVIIKSSQYQ